MRKIWNRPDSAVWSLSTCSAHGVPNVNICTYVTAVSLDPKLMAVAVYRGTATLDNCAVGRTVLLQLLTEELAPVIPIAGRQSGKDRPKIPRLTKRYPMREEQGLSYFTAAAGFLVLTIEQLVETTGDHVLIVGRVVRSKQLSAAPILTTSYLREKGYIRA